MESSKARNIPENIIKGLFDKEQRNKAEVDLEAYLKQNINQNKKSESIKDIVENFKVQIFDKSKEYRQFIIKGEISPIVTMNRLIQKYDDNNSEHLFILIQSIITLFNVLEWKILKDYGTKILNILTVNNHLFLPFFNEIFEGFIVLRSNRDMELVQIGKKWNTWIFETLKCKLKESQNKVPFDIVKFNKILAENIVKNYSVVIPWLLSYEEFPQLKIVHSLPAFLPGLFTLLTEKSKDASNQSEICLKKFQTFIEYNYQKYSNEEPELLDQIVAHIQVNCILSEKSRKNFAFQWLKQILNKIYLLLKNNKVIHSSLNLNGTGNLHINGRFSKFLQDKAKIRNSNLNIPPLFKGSITDLQEEINTNEFFLKKLQYQSDLDLKECFFFGEYKSDCPVKKMPKELLSKTFKIVLKQNNTDELNEYLRSIIQLVPIGMPGLDVKAMEKEIRISIKESNDAKVNLILYWYNLLFCKFKDEIFSDINETIDSLVKIFPKDNDSLMLKIFDFLFEVIGYNEEYFEPIVNKIIDKLIESNTSFNNYQNSFKLFSERLDIVHVFKIFSIKLLQKQDITLICEIVHKLNNYILLEQSAKRIRDMLLKYRKEKDKEAEEFFIAVFSIWSYNPIEALMLCFFSEFFELSYFLILKFVDVRLDSEYYTQLSQIVRLIESPIYNTIRMRLLEPVKNLYLVRTLYGILMLLPQGHAFNALSNRMKSVETLLEMEPDEENFEEENSEIMEEVNKCIKMFENVQKDIIEMENQQSNSSIIIISNMNSISNVTVSND